jgi:hypothetical protein
MHIFELILRMRQACNSPVLLQQLQLDNLTDHDDGHSNSGSTDSEMGLPAAGFSKNFSQPHNQLQAAAAVHSTKIGRLVRDLQSIVVKGNGCEPFATADRRPSKNRNSNTNQQETKCLVVSEWPSFLVRHE